jgi:hypothetical protein
LRKIGKVRVSPALVISIVALVLAASGTSLATSSIAFLAKAVGLSRPQKKQVTKIADKEIMSKAPGLSVLSATKAGSATTATRAANAADAESANNALSLGGIPASSYTRNDCNSRTGQVKGFALVEASGGFPSSFTDVPTSYNCSGQTVQARRVATGEYEVKFLGSPVALVVGSAYLPEVFISFLPNGPGEFLVVEYDPVLKAQLDEPFGVMAP